MSRLKSPIIANSIAYPQTAVLQLRAIVAGICTASVIYSLIVLWYVATFPDIGIRCLLPTESSPESASSIAVTKFVNSELDGIPYLPERGDLLLTIGREPVRNFLEFARGMSDLRSAKIPPGGQLAPGSDPAEYSADLVPGLVEIPDVDGTTATRMVEVTFLRPTSETPDNPLRTYVAVRPLQDYDVVLTMFWFLCQLAILLVALTAYWRRPTNRIVRTFCLMCAVSMAAFVGGFHWWIIAGTPLLNLPFILSASLLPAAAMHFFCTFPRDTWMLKRYPRAGVLGIYSPVASAALLLMFAYWSAYSLGGTIADAGQLSAFQKLATIGCNLVYGSGGTFAGSVAAGQLLHTLRTLVYFTIFLGSVYFAATVVALAFSLVRTQNVLERRQASGILLASLAAAVPILYTLYLAVYQQEEFALGKAQVPMFVASGLFMAAYAHGMLRHRLILADEILESGRQYSLMTAVVTTSAAMLLAGGIFATSVYALPPESSLPLRVSLFSILVVGVVFVLWTRDRLQAVVDRRFFSEKYQLDRTLQQLNQAAGYLTDPSAMAELTLRTCRDVIDASMAAMFVRDGSGTFRLIGVHNDPGMPDALPDSLPGQVRQAGPVIRRVPPASSRETISDLQRMLHSLKSELMCVLRDEHGVDGMIFVGRRSTGTAYSAEDIAFLQAIGQMTVLALHSSRANQNLARLNSELKVKVDRIAEQQRQLAILRGELTSLQDSMDESSPRAARDGFDRGQIRGSSTAIQSVLEIARKAADSTATVLIRGESGTGKELLARVVQSNSDRADQPLICVNCAALAPSLLESELFGHVRGAFTGANADKAGRFQAADGGTLFLDEIGDISLETQVKLLRVLQERRFEPVGSNTSVSTDVRLIAATNRNLEKMIARGEFREDLYYRLNVVSITLPALRDRREDLIDLVFYFLNRTVQKTRKKVRQIDKDALAALEKHAWPGNIRELENTIERAVILAEGETITVRDLPSEIADAPALTTVAESKRTEAPSVFGDSWPRIPGRTSAKPGDAGANNQESSGRVAGASDSRESRPANSPVPRNDETRGKAAVADEQSAPTVDADELAELQQALRSARGNKAQAARILHMPRSTFYSKLKKYGIGG
ncbi:MAG: sigma 54-interacting transcriptional regulator [Planctomycetaceae bacterium]